MKKKIIGLISIILLVILTSAGCITNDNNPYYFEPQEEYKLYSSEIRYNHSFSASDLLDALKPLNYTIRISGPYIKVYINISLSDINESCPSLNGHQLRDGSILSDDSKFLFRIYTHNDNKNIDVWYNRWEYWESPFLNITHSKIIIEKVVNHIQNLIYEYSLIQGEIYLIEDYIGPIP